MTAVLGPGSYAGEYKESYPICIEGSLGDPLEFTTHSKSLKRRGKIL